MDTESLKFALGEVNRKLVSKGHFSRSKSGLKKLLLTSLHSRELVGEEIKVTPTMVENDANILNVLFRFMDTIDGLRGLNEGNAALVETRDKQIRELQHEKRRAEFDHAVAKQRLENANSEISILQAQVAQLEKEKRAVLADRRRLLLEQEEKNKLAQREIRKRDLEIERARSESVSRKKRVVLAEINGNEQRKKVAEIISKELQQDIRNLHNDLEKEKENLQKQRRFLSLIHQRVTTGAAELPEEAGEEVRDIFHTLDKLEKNQVQDKLIQELEEKKATIENLNSELNSLSENHQSLMKTMEGWRKFRRESGRIE